MVPLVLPGVIFCIGLGMGIPSEFDEIDGVPRTWHCIVVSVPGTLVLRISVYLVSGISCAVKITLPF